MVEEAHSLQDVQRFFIIMSPTSRKSAPHRLIVIGKKRLPDPKRHERYFGFVLATGPKVSCHLLSTPAWQCPLAACML